MKQNNKNKKDEKKTVEVKREDKVDKVEDNKSIRKEGFWKYSVCI